MSDFLIMYRYIRKSVKNDRFLHRLNYFDNLESLGIIEFPSMTKYPLMRRKKKLLKMTVFCTYLANFIDEIAIFYKGFRTFV